MTNKEIVLIALNKYLVELCTSNEIHNLETIEQTEKIINHLK